MGRKYQSLFKEPDLGLRPYKRMGMNPLQPTFTTREGGGLESLTICEEIILLDRPTHKLNSGLNVSVAISFNANVPMSNTSAYACVKFLRGGKTSYTFL